MTSCSVSMKYETNSKLMRKNATRTMSRRRWESGMVSAISTTLLCSDERRCRMTRPVTADYQVCDASEQDKSDPHYSLFPRQKRCSRKKRREKARGKEKIVQSDR